MASENDIAALLAADKAARGEDKELVEFFEKLGYEVSYDGKAATGERWHEVLDDDELVMQIDFGVPLAAFLADLPFLIKRKEGPSGIDYTVNAERDSDLREMLRRANALKSGRLVERRSSPGAASAAISLLSKRR